MRLLKIMIVITPIIGLIIFFGSNTKSWILTDNEGNYVGIKKIVGGFLYYVIPIYQGIFMSYLLNELFLK